MDTLTFVSKLVESLAWPLVVLVIVLALQREIQELVPTLKKFKAGPVEAEFEKEVSELTKVAEEQTETLLPTTRATPEKQVLLQLVQINPRSAILEAWREVEEAKNQAKLWRTNQMFESPPGTSPPQVAPVQTESLFSQSDWKLYVELRSLRNKAAHAPNFAPNADAALKFIDLSERLRQALQQ